MEKYTIRFEKQGELIRKTGVPANEMWLDVGNALETGCIDHHQAAGYDSTLGAMVDHPEYLRAVRQCALEEKPVIIHLHRLPDADCIISFFAFRYYLERGEEEFTGFFGPGGRGHVLVSYINDIDSGRKKVTDSPTLYAVLCELHEAEDGTARPDQDVLDKGLALVALALAEREKTNGELTEMDLSGCLPDEFAPEIARILRGSFEQEKQSRNVEFYTVPVWKKEEGSMIVEDVYAAIWRGLPSFTNAYAHARKEGALLTVVPYSIKGENGAETTRVVISINPDKDPEKKYTLRPLAEMFEQMEQVEEQNDFERTGSYRRDHSEPRPGRDLYAEMPFAATSDPWHINSDENLIDSPRAWSLLDYRDIRKVIRKNGSAVRQAYTIGIGDGTVTALYDRKAVPLSVWQEENRKILAREKSYVLVWAEVDASLIGKNTRMLEAYCMSLTGRPLAERKEDSLYFPDYRTCIYSDLNCTIVLAATYDENNLRQLPIAALASLPDGKGAESLGASRLAEIVRILRSQRERLLDFGKRIGSISKDKRKKLEQLYSEFLAFSMEVQKDDVIVNAFERELYRFIQKIFSIDELYHTEMEELQLVVDESRNKLVSGFNLLTAIAAPFLIISALFEMGIVHFESLLDLSGCAARWGWGITVVLGVVSMAWLLRKK